MRMTEKSKKMRIETKKMAKKLNEREHEYNKRRNNK